MTNELDISWITAITTQTRVSQLMTLVALENIYSLARTLFFYSSTGGHLTGLSKGELTEDEVSEGVKEAGEERSLSVAAVEHEMEGIEEA